MQTAALLIQWGPKVWDQTEVVGFKMYFKPDLDFILFFIIKHEYFLHILSLIK